MRIALIVPGGVDRSARERVVPALLWLIERLANRHELHVIVLDYYIEPCTYGLLGATVHDVGRTRGPRGWRRIGITRKLRRAIDAYGPFDVLHAYWGMPAGIAAASLARRLGVPFVLTLSSGELVRLDSIEYGLQRRWIDRHAMALAIRRANVVTVPTQYMARLLDAQGIIPELIPSGIDTRLFRPTARVEGPPWRLIRVGSINLVKDHATLLQALARLPDTVALDIVGEDTMDGAMQRLAARLGLMQRVTFHGWQPIDRVAELYNAAHVHIVSSRHEACSIATLEAAATGLPTVGTTVGFVADWQPDRAVAVPPQDPAALAGAVAALLRDPGRRARIADAARRWTLEHDADWTANAFDRVYTRVTRP